MTHCWGWDQTVTVHIALSYHLAWDTFIFPLSHNFRFPMYVYCDVSVVARDKRVRMNDATQIFAVHCLAAGWLGLSLDRQKLQRRYFLTANLSLEVLSICLFQFNKKKLLSLPSFDWLKCLCIILMFHKVSMRPGTPGVERMKVTDAVIISKKWEIITGTEILGCWVHIRLKCHKKVTRG